MNRPWIMGTGFTRGIGLALATELRSHFNILSIQRPSLNMSHKNPNTEHFKTIYWDLGKKMSVEVRKQICAFTTSHNVTGLMHCAGVIDPAVSLQSSWGHTMQINCGSAIELIETVRSALKKTQEKPPFLLHLSSGAALNPYVGWEGYCTSKAALLMYFRALALKYSAEELLCLSIAPGTVMTDMMHQVLASDVNEFPAKEKFVQLHSKGLIEQPNEVAIKIKKILLNLSVNLQNIHGILYDLRS